MNRYKIPKHNGKIPTFLMWDWKEALAILFVFVMNYLIVGKGYENTDNFFHSLIILPAIFAILIMIIPEINIRVIEYIWKYIYYLFFMCKNFKFKER